MAPPRRARKPAAVATPRPAAPCRSCGRPLAAPSDVGWECQCGVVVCTTDSCIEDYFKFVAKGEATRCLSCGEIL